MAESGLANQKLTRHHFVLLDIEGEGEGEEARERERELIVTMAKIELKCVFVLSALLLCLWLPASHSAKKPVSIARKEDLRYIKCQVCEKLATQLYQQVKRKEAEISPKRVFLLTTLMRLIIVLRFDLILVLVFV